MDAKLVYFLLASCLLLVLTSGVHSEIEVNLQLQTNVTCNPSGVNDTCNPYDSFCNSAGMCQCMFDFFPSPIDQSKCENFRCHSTTDCSELYHDSNATCGPSSYCRCFDSFRLDAHTQSCVLEKPAHQLGGRCVADHQCGRNAACTTNGECRCPPGSVPETPFTCAEPSCSSNEFCHQNVTTNTVCDDGHCRCRAPIFEQDSETFECVRVLPDTLPLGAHCENSTYCGEGAKCTTGSKVCKCQLGYEATSETVCEIARCSKDEYCSKRIAPLTICYHKGDLHGSYCGCKVGYYENPYTFECSPVAPNIGQPCAQKDDKVYQSPCSLPSAYCNDDRKCACSRNLRPDKHIPWQCQKIE